MERAVVEGCVEAGCHERAPGPARYVAFIDAAGGSGSDSMTLAIGHTDRELGAVLDAVREVKPPFSQNAVVQDLADLMKSYRVSRAESDWWGGDWLCESFRKRGITVSPSAKPKSDIYREVLPALNAHRCALLDIPRLVTQLCGLERRTARGGRDSIDHAPGAHDDLANAVAGVRLMANVVQQPMRISEDFVRVSLMPRQKTGLGVIDDRCDGLPRSRARRKGIGRRCA